MPIGEPQAAYIQDGILKTPGIDYGRPLIVLDKHDRHILVRRDGHKTWNGMGRPWRWIPKRYTIFRIVREYQVDRKLFDLEAVQEFEATVKGRRVHSEAQAAFNRLSGRKVK